MRVENSLQNQDFFQLKISPEHQHKLQVNDKNTISIFNIFLAQLFGKWLCMNVEWIWFGSNFKWHPKSEHNNKEVINKNIKVTPLSQLHD